MFSDYPIPSISFNKLIPDIVFTCGFLIEQLNQQQSSLSSAGDIQALKKQMRSIFNTSNNYKPPADVLGLRSSYFDAEFFPYLNEIITIFPELSFDKQIHSQLIDSLWDYLMIMFNYLNITYEKCDETLIVEVMQCVHKQLLS